MKIKTHIKAGPTGTKCPGPRPDPTCETCAS